MRKSTLNRMLQLADIKPIIKEGKMKLSNFELVKESVDGNTYVIVRENKRYHIKKAQTKEGLTESDFDYVGGVMNKMKKSFSSYSDATKHLNLMFEEINNHYDVDFVDLLESDNVLSEKKFVLKLDKKKKSKPEPKPEDEFDFGGEAEEGEVDDEFDFGGEAEEGEVDDEFDFGGEAEEEDDLTLDDSDEEEEFDFGGEAEEEDDLELDDSDDEIKDIQSTTGKLGQQLRSVEDLSSDMQKWVAKSVLSALDLDNMDSEDKKDIIRTVKKKSEESEEDVESPEEEEFDFEGMEESYDNYMGDESDDDMDGMDNYSWDGVNTDSEFPSYSDVYDSENLKMRGIEMPINNKRHPRLKSTNRNDSYDSYMKDAFNEKSFDSWMRKMEELGITDYKYDSYMEDIVGTNNPNDEYSPNRRAWESKEEDTELGGDEHDRVAQPDEVGDDMLLLDIDEDMDSLYGPNIRKKYDRSDMSRARRQADKDITKHYYKPANPNYEMDPVEKWAKHKLPYDMRFMDENRNIMEDHFNDQMDTYEQEKAYEDVEKVVRRYGMDVDLRSKETSEDPEETLIYLDIVNGNKKILVARINSIGQIEVGDMRGNKFIGEPVDSVEDFIEIFDEDLTDKEKQKLGMMEDIEMNQPKRSPETQPNEPATKPGTPSRSPGRERPSRRPFTPPPHIKPGDEPGPKADYDDDMDDPFMSPSPAPSKPAPSKEPATKPGTPSRSPGRERPSRRPFTPPPHIKPGDEPGPKADYDDDVEFE